VARGTQHIRKRPEQASRPVRKQSRGDARKARRLDEAGLFFPGLRRHAKWVFVLLALVFAGGFVFLGVGSGSGGLGDILQGWIGQGGGASGPSISKLESKARAHPKDATAFRELATAYAGKQQTDKAIGALERYTLLRPSDADALQELAAQYQRKLQDISNQASVDPTLAAASVDLTNFVPASTTKLGQAYADTTALGDPISSAVTALASQKSSEYQQQLAVAAQKRVATYQKLVKLDPTDPATQFQLARAAQYLGDTTTAIAAYKQAKKLDPSSYGPYADQALKVLQPTTTTSSSK
jgi:tetratricopeptide (TPR) repeat protein